MPKSLPNDFFEGSLPVALVAGGAGFVGSHVCEALISRSVKVICLDNWQTGLKENINHLLLNKNFLLLETDVTEEITSRIKKVDYIFHLAGVESYLNGEDVSIENLEANSIGSRNLLDLAEKHKAKFLLASTIYVYSAKISKDNTSNYFGKSREEEGEFSHLEAKRFAEALVSEYGQKKGIDARIVRLGDVYGPRMMISTNNILARLVKQASYKEQLVVHGGEEIHVYPVFIDDVVDGIVKSTFIGGTKNLIVSLAGPKTSLFSLAQTIKSINPEELEISFKSDNLPKMGQVEEGVLRAGRGVISWDLTTTLEEGIKRTLDWFAYHQKYLPKTNSSMEKSKKTLNGQKEKVGGFISKFAKRVRVSPKNTDEKKQTHKEESFWEEKIQATKNPNKSSPKKSGGLRRAFVVIGFLIAWFIVLPIFAFYLGIGQLYLFKNAFAKGNIDSAQRWSSLAKLSFNQAENSFSWWFQVPGLKNESVRYANKSKSFGKLAEVATSAVQSNLHAKSYLEGVLGQGVNSEDPELLSLELKKLGEKVGFLEADLISSKVSLTAPFARNKIVQESTLKEIRELALALSYLVGESGSIFGGEHKKTYLVLFQDNTKLRPSGGLIRSYALMSFENGKLANVDVQDVDKADEQLKGQVDPPQSIKDYLGETSWLLKDSNWSPDFPSSAQRSAWFIDKELGVSIDGVVGVDLEFIKELLSFTGPVNVDDLNLTLNSDNLYENASNLQVSDAAQKRFFTSLLREVIELSTVSPGKNLNAFAQAVVSSTPQRHWAVWTKDTNIAQVLSQAGWDGAVKQLSCKEGSIKEGGCIADYLQISDAHTTPGGRPEKSYSMEIYPTNEKVSHRLLISYENKSGEYKSFVRVIVPKPSQIVQATSVDPQETKQDDLKIDESFENNKKSFGFLVNIPANTKKQIVLLWDLPLSRDISKSKVAGDSTVGQENLVFFWQKQLGVLQDPVSLRVNLPDEAQSITSFPTPSLTTEGSISYNTNLSRDLLTQTTWQKK